MEKKTYNPDTVRSVLSYFVFALITFLILCFYSQDQEQKRVVEEVAHAAVVQKKVIDEMVARDLCLSKPEGRQSFKK